MRHFLYFSFPFNSEMIDGFINKNGPIENNKSYTLNRQTLKVW